MKNINGLNVLKAINFFSLVYIISSFLGSFLDDLMYKLGSIILIFIGSAIIFFIKKIYVSEYSNFLNESRNGISVLGVIFLITLLREDFSSKFDALAPFIIIYIVSCVIILRLLRQAKNSTENKTIQRLNYIYSFSILAIAIVFGFESFRSFLFKSIIGLWHLIPNIVYKILYWIIYGVAYVLSIPFEFLLNLLKLRKLDLKGMGGVKGMKGVDKDFQSKIDYVFNSELFRIVVWVLVISFIVYVIYKIFNKNAIIKHNEQEFEEEKEFISEDDFAAPSFLKKISELVKIRNNNESIRFYYQKLLRLCKKKEIEILCSDTSLDVNSKSGFDINQMSYLRHLYIRVRYGKYIVSDEDYREFVKTFKLLDTENRRD